MKIIEYSHGFTVTDLTHVQSKVTKEFCLRLVQYGLAKKGRKFVKVAMKTYASATANRAIFRFHINMLDEFKHHLKVNGIGQEDIKHTLKRVDKGKIKKFKFRPIDMPPPRDYQVPIIKYCLDNTTRAKIVTLQTGKGKTFISMSAAMERGVRTAIILKSAFVFRWYDDLRAKFDFKELEIVVVGSTEEFIKMQKLALLDDLDVGVIIISHGLMRNYLKDYEKSNGRSKKYPIKPQDFYERMGIGLRIIDEVHIDFHNVFKQILFTHVDQTLDLSATLVSSDASMNRMYEIAFPAATRNNGGTYDKFIDVTAIIYRMANTKRIRYTGAIGYNHIEFESSIMKQKDLRERYRDFIVGRVKAYYLDIKQPGMKYLVFFASIDMCTYMTKAIAKAATGLVVKRYCEDDPNENLTESDIAVSTLLSAGTAVDIPNLLGALITTNVNSRQSNEQALGRPRRLVNYEDVSPTVHYLICEDIEQHMAYHRNKQEFFKGKVKSHKENYINFTL